mmetsp:Transcript_15461/g.42279  ORF Transcript_15461/g.42279 Transcript_15461/m.42279 type:complete len:216 (+) Transcript_15461:51-698(+)
MVREPRARITENSNYVSRPRRQDPLTSRLRHISHKERLLHARTMSNTTVASRAEWATCAAEICGTTIVGGGTFFIATPARDPAHARLVRVPSANAWLASPVGLRARGTLESVVDITFAVARARLCVQSTTRATRDGALASVLAIATSTPLPTRTLAGVVLRGLVKHKSLSWVAHKVQDVAELHELVADDRTAICHGSAGEEVLQISRIYIVSAQL